MPIDPNIALQIKPVDIQSPLEQYSQVAQIKSLGQLGQMRDVQLQEAKRGLDDQTALRDAYKQNTVIGPDGQPTVNRQGVLSQLSKTNPQAAIAQQKDWQNQDLDKITKQHATAKDILAGIHDQASQDQAIAQAKQLGLPPLDHQLPPQYDPNAVQALVVSNLKAEDQIAQANKNREFALKQQENQEKHTENSLKRQELGSNKQSNAVRQIDQMLESARGNKAVNQAESDLYASSKIKGLLAQYPDPNTMPPEMVKLLVSEVGKVAQGGSPTMDELKGLTPNTIFGGKMASATENLMNHPSGANAGAFLKQYSSYADSVAGDAKKLLKDRYGRIIETNKEGLGSKYESVKKQYLSRFDEPAGGTTVQMRDPKGNIREVPADQVDAAKAAGGVPL